MIRKIGSTHFSSGGGGISCIGVELGVFSISIIARGASGSGRGATALSIGASPSAVGSDVFPALLPNLTAFHKLGSLEKTFFCGFSRALYSGF
jgi:hypothetical protein